MPTGPSIILPRGYRGRTTKPGRGNPAHLNRGHRLARGLVSYLVLNDGDVDVLPRDLVSGHKASSSNNVVWAEDAVGTHLDFSGDNPLDVILTNPAIQVRPPCCVFIYAAFEQFGQPRVFHTDDSEADGTSSGIWFDIHSINGDWTLNYGTHGGTGSSHRLTADYAGLFSNDQKPHTFGNNFFPPDTSVISDVYYDGVITSVTPTFSGTGTGIGYSTTRFGKIGMTTGVQDALSQFYMVAVWNRTLSAADHASMAANPWQLIRGSRSTTSIFLLSPPPVRPKIILPRGYRGRTTKPGRGQPAYLNRQDPLARGLVAYYPLNEGGDTLPVDLVSGHKASASTNVAWADDINGVHLDFTSTLAHIDLSHPRIENLFPPCCLMLLASVTGSGANTYVMTTNDFDDGSGTYSGATIQFNTNGTVTIHYGENNPPAAGARRSADYASTFTADVLTHWGFNLLPPFGANAVNSELFIDGIQSTVTPSFSGTGDGLAYQASESGGKLGRNTTINVTGQYYFAAFWQRALSPAEHASMAANPWQLIKGSRSRRIFLLSPNNPAAGTLTLAGQQVSLEIGLAPNVGVLGLAGVQVIVNDIVETPSSGALTLLGIQPTVAVTQDVAPGAGILTLVGVQAQLLVGPSIAPTSGTLTLAGQLARLEIGLAPNVGVLSLAGVQVILNDIVKTPSPGALTLLGIQPTVAVTQDVAPGAGILTLAGVQASVLTGEDTRPVVGVLGLTGQQIKLSIGLRPGTGILSLAGGQVLLPPININPAAGVLGLAGVQVVTTGPTNIRISQLLVEYLGSDGTPIKRQLNEQYNLDSDTAFVRHLDTAYQLPAVVPGTRQLNAHYNLPDIKFIPRFLNEQYDLKAYVPLTRQLNTDYEIPLFASVKRQLNAHYDLPIFAPATRHLDTDYDLPLFASRTRHVDGHYDLPGITGVTRQLGAEYSLNAFLPAFRSLDGHYDLPVFLDRTRQLDGHYDLQAALDQIRQLNEQYILPDGTGVTRQLQAEYLLDAFLPATRELNGRYDLQAFQILQRSLDSHHNLQAFQELLRRLNAHYDLPDGLASIRQLGAEYLLDAFEPALRALNGHYDLQTFQSLRRSFDTHYDLQAFLNFTRSLDAHYELPDGLGFIRQLSDEYILNAFVPALRQLSGHYDLQAFQDIQRALDAAYQLNAFDSVTRQLGALYDLQAYAARKRLLNEEYDLQAFLEVQRLLDGHYDLQALVGVTRHLDEEYDLQTFLERIRQLNGHYDLQAFQDAIRHLNGEYDLQVYAQLCRHLNEQYLLDAAQVFYTWLMNLTTNAPSRYEQFPFHSLARFNQEYFGARADGIYRLDAATDRNDITGSHTGAVDQATALVDSAATFVTKNVKIGEVITNDTDGSSGTVVARLSETALTTSALTGGTDDDWDTGDSYTIQHLADIAAFADTGKLSLGTNRLKRVPQAFLGEDSDGTLKISFVTDNGNTHGPYNIRSSASAIKPARGKFGRGIKSRYWEFKLENKDGASLQLDKVQLEVEDYQSRVK